MIEINSVDRYVLESIENIEDEYFATVFTNVREIQQFLQNRLGEFRNDDFYYYGERVFCYELYHQLRKTIKKLKRKNPDFIDIKVQGEVRKMNIIKLLQEIGLDSFSSDKIPDLIIHNPFTIDNQICAIEVKSKGNISKEEVYRDIEKLNIYCEKLQFKNGYFIVINTSCKHIVNLLQDLDLNSFQCKDKIKIICKEKPNINSKIIAIN